MPKATTKSRGRPTKDSPNVEPTMKFGAGGQVMDISYDDLCDAGKSEPIAELVPPRLTTASIQISERDLMEAGGSGTSGTTHMNDPTEVAESGFNTILTRSRRLTYASQLDCSKKSTVPTILTSTVAITNPIRKQRHTLTATRRLRSATEKKTTTGARVAPYPAIPTRRSLPKEDSNVYNLDNLAEAIQVIQKPKRGYPTSKNVTKRGWTKDTDDSSQHEGTDDDYELEE